MAVIKRGKTFGVQVYVRGERRWLGTFPTRAEAKRAEREALSQRLLPGRETVAEFADRWLVDFNHRGRWGEETVRNLGYALRPFVARFGAQRLSAFPMSEARPWAASQPQHVVKAARACMSDAVASELCPRNPLAKLGFEQSRGRRGIVTLDEEELHLLADCALPLGWPQLRPLILFLGYQGVRPFACAAEIRFEDISGDMLYLRNPGKRVPPRHVLLLDEPARAIAQMQRPLRAEYLFTTPTGRRLSKTNTLYWWNQVRSAFESKLDPRRAEQLREARSDRGTMDLYELRHTAATLMLRQGISPEDVAHQLGHTDGGYQVRRCYGHLTDEDRMDSVRRSMAIPHAAVGGNRA